MVNRRRSDPLAYTTVLSVLVNLEKKGLVTHVAEGRAFRFAAKSTEAEFAQRRAREHSRELLRCFGDAAISAFLSEVKSDTGFQAQLRRLVKEDDGGKETGS